VDLTHYREPDDFDPSLYLMGIDEGTAMFYTTYSQSGVKKVYIEGHYIGDISKYSSSYNIPDCGEKGTLTIRLWDGSYEYKVVDDEFTWRGTLYITPGDCSKIKISK